MISSGFKSLLNLINECRCIYIRFGVDRLKVVLILRQDSVEIRAMRDFPHVLRLVRNIPLEGKVAKMNIYTPTFIS